MIEKEDERDSQTREANKSEDKCREEAEIERKEQVKKKQTNAAKKKLLH